MPKQQQQQHGAMARHNHCPQQNSEQCISRQAYALKFHPRHFFIPTLIERTHSVRIDRAILVWGIVARLWETSSKPQHHVLLVVERTGPFDLTKTLTTTKADLCPHGMSSNNNNNSHQRSCRTGSFPTV